MKENVWFFGVEYNSLNEINGHPNSWTSCGPQEIELDKELLESIGFGEKPVTQMYLIDQSRIIYIFAFERAAQIFSEGFMTGKMFTESPEEMWQDFMEQTIRAAQARQILDVRK